MLQIGYKSSRFEPAGFVLGEWASQWAGPLLGIAEEGARVIYEKVRVADMHLA